MGRECSKERNQQLRTEKDHIAKHFQAHGVTPGWHVQHHFELEHAGAQGEDESLPHGGSRGCS